MAFGRPPFANHPVTKASSQRLKKKFQAFEAKGGWKPFNLTHLQASLQIGAKLFSTHRAFGQCRLEQVVLRQDNVTYSPTWCFTVTEPTKRAVPGQVMRWLGKWAAKRPKPEIVQFCTTPPAPSEMIVHSAAMAAVRTPIALQLFLQPPAWQLKPLSSRHQPLLQEPSLQPPPPVPRAQP